jgi:hypothetical protein
MSKPVEADRGAEPMKTPRRPLALLSLALLACAGLALTAQNIDAWAANDDGHELARAGVEGEGDIPLPARLS